MAPSTLVMAGRQRFSSCRPAPGASRAAGCVPTHLSTSVCVRHGPAPGAAHTRHTERPPRGTPPRCSTRPPAPGCLPRMPRGPPAPLAPSCCRRQKTGQRPHDVTHTRVCVRAAGTMLRELVSDAARAAAARDVSVMASRVAAHHAMVASTLQLLESTLPALVGGMAGAAGRHRHPRCADVEHLVRQAISPENLCQMYEGWTPWI
ncbi:MAG: hypothetical protein WDW38_009423 [Sanguina aurantia]